MMRSLSSAVAGLRAHQTKMDVIGNNIANVNTNSFKSSRTTFNDVYYQTLSAGRSGNTARGGMNPTQIGYGAQVSTIDMMMSNGGGQYTGRPSDVYIDGDGFFTVKTSDGSTYYTRLGNFKFDNDGYLVDYAGNKILGIPLDTGTTGTGNSTGKVKDPTGSGGYYDEAQLIEIKLGNATNKATPPVTANIQDFITSVSIGSDGSITAITNEEIEYNGETIGKNEVIYLGKIAIANFANQDGLVEKGQSYYQVGAATGSAKYSTADNKGAGKTVAGYLEMSNVDLSKEFTDMITTQRGFQANTRIITVSDEMLQELVNLKR